VTPAATARMQSVARRRRGRDVSGILVLDKPQGMSSNDAVQKAKRLFNARKVGHTGALDPLATGVLPLCFGEATKFSQYLLTSDKRYWVRIRLGVATDSGDADGEVTAIRAVEGVDEAAVEAALRFFRGEIDQVPSMFSAIKHQGQPLYKLARKGIEIERQARRVTIYANELLSLDGDTVELAIHCSKGTYVRTIAEELGELLGCGAHVIELRRTSAGPYSEEDLVTFDELEAAREKGSLDPFLLPVASAVREWPEVKLSDNTAYYLRQGQPVIVPHAPTSGWVRLSEVEQDATTRFIGVGEILEDGRVAPRRLVVESAE
jgi:tRNA pseudouridine55 synthase